MSAAVALWIVFGIVTFAGRLAIQRLTTGSWGFNGIGGAEPVAVAGGLLFVAALVVSVLGALLGALDVSAPVAGLDRGGFRLAGFALFALGLAGTFGAQLAMGRSWRIGVAEAERTELVTGGPFESVRNPIYTAMILAVAGLALLARTWLSLAGLCLLIGALEVQVRLVEEPHLRRAHGEAFAGWASRAGRFLPGIGRLR